MVRSVSSLYPLDVDEQFRRVSLEPDSTYRQIYITGLSRSHYNFILRDYAYFQFGWTSEHSWRLAYYPNPWISGISSAISKLDHWEALEEIGALTNDESDELINELPYHASIPPIRFEYAVSQYREMAHPAAHFHIGRHTDNRWPSARLLTPLSFAMFMAKMYYSENWRPLSNFANPPTENCVEQALIQSLIDPGQVHSFSAEEKLSFYFSAR